MSQCKLHDKLSLTGQRRPAAARPDTRAAVGPWPRAAVSAFMLRRTRLSTPNAIEVPGSLLKAIQQRLARDDVDAILSSAGPLTNWDRQQLELARKSWQDQCQKAGGMIQAINARLAAGQDSQSGAHR